jgi:hypothetical protein
VSHSGDLYRLVRRLEPKEGLAPYVEGHRDEPKSSSCCVNEAQRSCGIEASYSGALSRIVV